MDFVKQAAAAFVGSFIAFALVGVIGYFSVTGYVDGKLEVANATLDKVMAVVEVSATKIDSLVTAFTNGVGKVDDVVTDSKIYNRFFGEKQE